MNDLLHENSNYYVVISDAMIESDGANYDSCYAVVNTETGVVELYTTCLPAAIHSAEQWNHAIVTEAWTWRDKAGVNGAH